MIKVKKCKHGMSLNKICYRCTGGQSDPGRDADIYNDLYKNRVDNSSFVMARILAKNINLWTKTHSMPEERYFREIENSRKLAFSVNTLRQSYYVIRDFKDILDSTDKNISFTCYREIASSKVSNEQKSEIREIAESERMTHREVRAYIKKNYKKQVTDVYHETFDVSSIENSLREIERFLMEHNVKKDDEITIKVKQIKEGS